MAMPGRKYEPVTGYRYGFNGKEKDAETATQDYGMRIYDPRLCRFLSVDPIADEYAELTPYQFASNTPVQAIDLDGLEKFQTTVNGNTYTVYGPITTEEAKKRLKALIPQEEKDKYAQQVVNTYLRIPSEQDKTNSRILNNLADYSESGLNIAEGGLRILTYGIGNKVLDKPLKQARASIKEMRNLANPSEEPAARPTTAKIRGVDAEQVRTQSPTAGQTNNTNVPREKSSILRKKWEEHHGQKWPKEPENPQRNQSVKHKRPLADGGDNSVENIEPQPWKQHLDEHKRNGDFKRWGQRAKGCRKFDE